MLWSSSGELSESHRWSTQGPADSQVHRFCFALVLFHLILSASLIGVQSTKTKRASIQNG
jgi:hypothetical protein